MKNTSNMDKNLMKGTDFKKIIPILAECRLIEPIGDIDPNCYVAEQSTGWENVANCASSLTGGKWLASPHGVVWVNGNKSYYIISRKEYFEVREAQIVCEYLTGERGGYSIASNSRKVWKWALEARPQTCNWRAIQRGTGIGYHHCHSGFYPNMQLLDMSSCYWELLMDLKTRKWEHFGRGLLLPEDETREEKARLLAVRDVLGEFKRMRNSVWGSALGRLLPGKCHKRGQYVDDAAYPGTHQTCAVMVARMAWELTGLAVQETGAVYSKTDSIICPLGREPKVWNTYGRRWKVQASGDADVRSTDVYRVGDVQKKLYRAPDRWREDTDMPEAVDTLFLDRYLLHYTRGKTLC